MEKDMLDKVVNKILYLNAFLEAMQTLKTTAKEIEDKLKLVFAKEEYVYMANEITFLIHFFKENGIDFSDNKVISDFYDSVKDKMYKKKFVCNGGKIEECKKGTVQERFEQLKSTGMLDKFKELLENQ